MAGPADKSEKWNAQQEAERAFALNDHVRAVIFFSDAPVAALRRLDQGPSWRQHKNLSQEIFELLRIRKSDEVRDKIANVRWHGPQTIFWTTSVAGSHWFNRRHRPGLAGTPLAARYAPHLVEWRTWTTG